MESRLRSQSEGCMRGNRAVGVLVAVVLSFPASAAAQDSAKPSKLTIEQLVEIKHPSNPAWSPDGKHVVFTWDRAGVADFYVANAEGFGQPVVLTSFPEGQVEQAFWGRDSQTVYFPHEDHLWQASIHGGAAKPAWTASGGESDFVASPDAMRIAFVRSSAADEDAAHKSDLVVRALSDGSESVVAQDNVSITRPIWSPNGASLAYTAGHKTINHDETPAYSGKKIIYRIWEYVPGQIFAVRIAGGQPVAIGSPGEYGGLAWVDGTHLVYDSESKDFKKYSIYVANTADGKPREIHSITEEQFWSIPDWGEAGAQPWPSPDGKWIAFLSDEDGWDHLYVMPSAGGKAVQITKGHFEAWRPAWSHDSTRIAFDANEVDRPGDRHIGIANIAGDPSHATVTYVTAGNGTNIEPHWSADDKYLVYQPTDTHNRPDVFAIDAKANAKPVRLSDSMPAGHVKSQFVEPPVVRFPGAGGKHVPWGHLLAKSF